jgi:hypothetical protein
MLEPLTIYVVDRIPMHSVSGEQEMADMETIDVSHDSVVVLKHHGSYMQQNRDYQVRNAFNGGVADKAKYAQSYQVRRQARMRYCECCCWRNAGH